MFRTVPLSIIRSFSLYTQQWYMSRKLYDVYHCCGQSKNLLMMDRGTVRNMQSFISKINLRNQCIQLVLLQEFITMHGHLNVTLVYVSFISLYTYEFTYLPVYLSLYVFTHSFNLSIYIFTYFTVLLKFSCFRLVLQVTLVLRTKTRTTPEYCF